MGGGSGGLRRAISFVIRFGVMRTIDRARVKLQSVIRIGGVHLSLREEDGKTAACGVADPEPRRNPLQDNGLVCAVAALWLYVALIFGG